MLKKISLKLAFIYSTIFITGILILNTLIVYVYSENQMDKTELMFKEIGKFYSELIRNGVKIQNFATNKETPSNNYRLLVMNNLGEVTFDSLKIYDEKTITCPEFRYSLEHKKYCIGYYSNDEKKTAVLAYPIIDLDNVSKVLVISSDIQEVYSDINNFASKVSLVSMMILIIVFIMSIVMGKRITKPINELTDASMRIQEGNFNVTVDIKREDEIGKLANTFNLMSQELYKIDIGRKRFVSDVSHELKTPLASIKALIHPLIEGEFDISVYKEYLTDVDNEIDRLSNLVKSLITSCRLEEINLKLEEVNLYDEVEIVIKVLEKIAIEKNITLHNNCSFGYTIVADKNMLKEVLINLIDNGVKYCNENGSVTVSTKENILFLVQDNGIGIAPKHHPLIFDNFYRVDDARARDCGGSGIGLFIVKRICTLHGWDIVLESEESVGSKFIILKKNISQEGELL